MGLGSAANNLLRKVGFEVHRYVTSSSPKAELVASLRTFDIDLVLDVGANEGQFAFELRRSGYTGKIVSFEPLSEAHVKLLQASDGDTKWDAYSRCALGDHNGEVELNIAGNSLSSSILPMLESHRSA